MRRVSLDCRPEPLEFAPDAAALIVNDMQNAFVSPGGYLDRAGFDIAEAPRVVAAVGEAISAARGAGMPVFFFQNGIDLELQAVAASAQKAA